MEGASAWSCCLSSTVQRSSSTEKKTRWFPSSTHSFSSNTSLDHRSVLNLPVLHRFNTSHRMNEELVVNGGFTNISVHNFSEKLLEQLVHFHVMKLDGGFFLWVGSAPVLSNMAVSMSSRHDSTPLSTLMMGDPSDTTASSLAQRLAKRTKKQVFVSYSLPATDSTLGLLVEQRIGKELQLHPEVF
ncbi:proteasome assembly chaperone 4-like isoform X6 [Gouania willdenowi]|uniref:proteasome assembly chaperone 4-like isoform X6 n=1 Tax=Gouania willdenowi TaxID=441366 RepID=UPI00105680E9|nr:valacyclovir hydrolase isoform X6 [Gouania willdenowi]